MNKCNIFIDNLIINYGTLLILKRLNFFLN